MDEATTSSSVGLRELKNHLSRYVQVAHEGGEVVITDRGKPVARIVPVDPKRSKLDAMIAAGRVRPALRRDVELPEPIPVTGSITDHPEAWRGRY